MTGIEILVTAREVEADCPGDPKTEKDEYGRNGHGDCPCAHGWLMVGTTTVQAWLEWLTKKVEAG